jgi:hypothetical protein
MSLANCLGFAIVFDETKTGSRYFVGLNVIKSFAAKAIASAIMQVSRIQ